MHSKDSTPQRYGLLRTCLYLKVVVYLYLIDVLVDVITVLLVRYSKLIASILAASRFCKEVVGKKIRILC